MRIKTCWLKGEGAKSVYRSLHKIKIAIYCYFTTPKVAQQKPRQRQDHSHNTYFPAYSSLLVAAAATAPRQIVVYQLPRANHYPTGHSNDYGSLRERWYKIMLTMVPKPPEILSSTIQAEEHPLKRDYCGWLMPSNGIIINPTDSHHQFVECAKSKHDNIIVLLLINILCVCAHLCKSGRNASWVGGVRWTKCRSEWCLNENTRNRKLDL